MLNEDKEKVISIVSAILESALLDLVDLTIKYQGSTSIINVLADKPRGGITIEECSIVNRQIIQEFDAKMLLMGDYIVEVSSPGLDRPLKTQKDFARVLGHKVHFYLAQKVDDRIDHEGEVRIVNQENVIIQTPKGEVSIPFHVINKAIWVIE